MTVNQHKAQQILMLFRCGSASFDDTYKRISELGFVCGPQLFMDRDQPLYDTETKQHLEL